MELGAELLVETIAGLERGSISRIPQDHEKATYAPMMSKELGKINWNEKAINIQNLVRGTQPWPGAFTTYKENNIKILEVDIVNKFNDEENGKVVKVNNEGIYVNTLDNCIVIKQIQFPGKKMYVSIRFLKRQ